MDEPLGTVEIGRSTRLVFALNNWKGRQLAMVRKFVNTDKYDGPTKSGFTMSGKVLVDVVGVLEQLRGEVCRREGAEYARVSKGKEIDIVVTTITPDDGQALPGVDVREHVCSNAYTGPTKKGIRFAWEKLPEVIACLKTLAEKLGNTESPQKALFPGFEPDWKEKARTITNTAPSQRDDILAELLPMGIKEFPISFLDEVPPAGIELTLPSEPIHVTQSADGTQAVRSDLDFSHKVRNATEGNYIVYAHMRGERTVIVPDKMLDVFKAVKAYENHVRELKQSLIHAYQRKSGNRPMAEHQARQVFRNNGLPWIE